jgi:amidophosphoribosyltransferase
MQSIDPKDVFAAVRAVMGRCKGAYGVVVSGGLLGVAYMHAWQGLPTGCDTLGEVEVGVRWLWLSCDMSCAAQMLITGVGLLGFRDPHGIRPLVLGKRASETAAGRTDYIMASESVAIDTLRFELERDVGPGEALLITASGERHHAVCAAAPLHRPCIFEYVYFARPDSVLDGVPVYQARLNMGEELAKRIMRLDPKHDIDVVIPVPDTSRTSALQCAYTLGKCVCVCPSRKPCRVTITREGGRPDS